MGRSLSIDLPELLNVDPSGFFPFKLDKSVCIKKKAEDFVVEEIMPDGTVLGIDGNISLKEMGGPFTWFVLKKVNWTTDMAVRRIAKYLHISFKRFNYAGTKDRRAITTQLVSVFGVDKEKLLDVKVKDISIFSPAKMPEKVKLGYLLGNKFSVRFDLDVENIISTMDKLKGLFPNYFGLQRFGSSRLNTHKVGYLLLKGRFRDAALLFLTDITGEVNKSAIEARVELAETMDFSKAFKSFPKYLKHERLMLHHLSRHSNDFVNAFRRLPRHTLLMFVHSIQSFIFNVLLSRRVREEGMDLSPLPGEWMCSADKFGFPDLSKRGDSFLVGRLIGYETAVNDVEADLLSELDLSIDDFKVRSIPELHSRGTDRVLLAPFMSPNFSNGVFSFSLPKGSYATVFLNNFADIKQPPSDGC